MDEMFPDGQQVSAFIKGTQRVIEGTLLTRDDNIRVVLKEDGKFVRLSNLHKIVALKEDAAADLDKQIEGLFDNTFDFETVKKNNKKDEVLDAGAKVISGSEEAKKAGLNDPEKLKKEILEPKYAAIEMERTAEDTAGGDEAKAEQAVLDQYKTLKESVDESLRDELGGEVEDDYEIEDEGIDDAEGIISGLFDEKADDPEVEVEDDAFDYEDPEYKSISEDTWWSAVLDAVNHIDEEESALRKYILDNYEVTPEDVDEILADAYSQKLVTLEAPLEDENDEVADEFEAAIDDYEGDDDGVLDHLVAEFDIPEVEAERILIECGHSRSKTILGLADYVRKHL